MFIDLHGVAIHYEVMGSGIPLLCLPPFPFDHRIWHQQASLSDMAQLILPDLRGTGKSDVTDGPYTMDLLASDMVALFDHLQIHKAVVMGVSMGAYVAFSMCDRYPERIRGLVLADTRAEADTPQQAERRRATVDGLRTTGTDILRNRVNDLFAASTHRERPQLVEEMQALVSEANPEGLAQETLGMAIRPDRRDLLPKIKVPVLVICGDEDTVSPCEGMMEMANAIPHAEYATIAKAGHLSPLEQPGAFNALVRNYLLELEAEG
ncbi:MAG: alpha/beta fold hydrolase [Armatimonadota bacterium]